MFYDFLRICIVSEFLPKYFSKVLDVGTWDLSHETVWPCRALVRLVVALVGPGAISKCSRITTLI